MNDFGLGSALGAASAQGPELGSTFTTSTLSYPIYQYFPFGASYLRAGYNGDSWILQQVGENSKWVWVEIEELVYDELDLDDVEEV